MGAPPRTRVRVLELLAERKALTSTELRDRLGWKVSSGNIWAVVKRLHQERVIYISSWKRSYGTRGAMGSRWKLGSRLDAPKPEKDRAADSRRYWANLDPTVKKYRTQRYKGRLSPWTGLRVLSLQQQPKRPRKARVEKGNGTVP